MSGSAGNKAGSGNDSGEHGLSLDNTERAQLVNDIGRFMPAFIHLAKLAITRRGKVVGVERDESEAIR